MSGFKRSQLKKGTVLMAAAVATSCLLMVGCIPGQTPTPEPLAVSATASPTTGQAPLQVALAAAATGGSGTFTYAWTSTPAAIFSAPNAANTTATLAVAGTYTITVTVNDGSSTVSDSVIVTVTAVIPPVSNLAVTATATPASLAAPNTSVLSAAPTGGTAPYTFSWLQTGGAPVTLDNPDQQTATAHFTATGTYTFTVTVTDANDNHATSAAVTVNVTSETLAFTIDPLDDLVGSTGDDKFVSVNSTNPGGDITLQATDKANGDGGADALDITATGLAPFAIPAATITDIETINVTDVTAPGGATTLDATNITGLTTLNLLAGSQDLIANNLGNIVNAGITSSGKSLTLNFAPASVTAGTADALTLTLAGASGGGTFTADGIETLNVLSNTAANKITLSDNALATLNVSGDQKLTLEGLVGVPGALTIAAGGQTAGGMVFTAPAGIDVTFTGGAGNDRVTFAAGDFTSGDVLNGDGGTNTLVLADAVLDATIAADLKAAINAVTNFQILKLTGAGVKLDVPQVTPFTQFDFAGGGAIVVTNVSTADQFTVSAAAASENFTRVDPTQNILNVTIASGATPAVAVNAGTLTANETTVNITSGGANGNAVVVTDAGATINVLGSKDISVTLGAAASLTAASGFTGKLTALGSGGDDVITGSPQADTIQGNAGQDFMTGGAGADVFRFALPGDVTAGTPDIIADFVCGTDKLSFNGALAAFNLVGGNTIDAANVATGGFAPTNNVVSITTAASGATSAAAATAIGNASAAYALGDQVLFIVHTATDSYVFLFTSAGADATVTAAELGAGPIIKLTGNTCANATADVVLEP